MKSIMFLLLMPLLLNGREPDAIELKSHLKDAEFNDLDEIVENKYFRVLTSRNAFDYHIFQGQHRGYQFELIKEFAKALNKKYSKKDGLKIQFELIPVDYDQAIPMLLEGKGDIIAANLTIKESRKKRVAFSKPVQAVSELLVTRKELAGQEPFGERIALRKSSSYYQSVKNWNTKNPDRFFQVELVDESQTPEAIMELVAAKKYDYALIDSNIFEVASKVHHNLALAKKQPFKSGKAELAFAVRKDSKKLLKELNAFIPAIKEGSFLGNVISRKYFNDALLLKTQTQDDGKISPYDGLLKKYALEYGWDWKLLAALCFQESRFQADIVNKWGAIGLFQVKQITANEPYVNIPNITGIKNIENNIRAGVKYLSWIRERYFKNLPEEKKIRMSMAAYNAGPGRVIKARKLAKEMGLDPNVWFRNVELAMAKMRKIEPVTYVSEINKRYVSYSLLYPEEN